MTADDRLARAYRRLLRAYPRWYRRERGTELLTTLLDAAAPGKRRPGVQDLRDLIGGGLRTRLRVPRNAPARLVAGQVALYVAVVAAAVGVLLSGYPGPPGEDEAVAAAAAAVPDRPRNVPGPPLRCDLICPDPADDDVTAYRRGWDHTDEVRVGYDLPRERASTVVADARRRLAAAGWLVTELRTQDDGIVWFEATDGRLNLVVTGGAPAGRAVNIVVSKGLPMRATALLAGGFTTGLLAGWLVAAWALQRFRSHGNRRRGIVIAVAGPYLFFGTLLSLATAWTAVVAGATGPAARAVKIPLLVLPDPATAYWAAPALVALSGLAALALSALPGPARPPVLTRGVRVS